MPEDKMDALLDMISRIDERVKLIQEKQHELDKRFEESLAMRQEGLQRLAVVEFKANQSKDLSDDIQNLASEHSQCQLQCRSDIFSIDKRLSTLEADSGRTQDRWNKIFTFIIQLVWVLLAAWLLLKLNLQAPAVP